MIIGHTVVSEPAALPVALSTVKEAILVTESSQDALITTMIKASAARLSNYCRRSFQTTTYALTLDDFYSDTIYLPMPTLEAISAVYYYDADNTENTLSSSYYRADTIRSALVLNDNYSWPSVGRAINGVKVQYTAGYGTAEASVPDGIQLAIIQDVAELYNNRSGGCEISDKVKNTLTPYKLHDYLGVAPSVYGREVWPYGL